MTSRKGYVEVREYLREHVRPQTVGVLFHRPLSACTDLIADSGCRLCRTVEPGPPTEAVTEHPALERASHVPSVIVLEAVREDAGVLH